MDWAQWALEVARVIIWPLVIVVVLWWLREPIRERLGNVEKVSALGVDLEMAKRRVEKEARDVADALTEPDKPADEVGEEQQATAQDRVDVRDEVHVEITRGPDQTVYPDPVQPQLSNGQRRAIGELVEQAAEWGRVRAQAGLPVDGAYLDWHDGVPTLVVPETPQRPSLAARRAKAIDKAAREADEAELVRRLEVHVDQLDRDRRRAQTGLVNDPSQRWVAEQRYEEAVNRLRRLDPNSAYLP